MQTKLNVKLLSHTMNPELVIASAGKLCYSPSTIDELIEKQDDESVEKFINRLVSMGHESPLEHAVFNFAVEGVSRSLTHQLVRHRIASYSQQSQRYVDLEENFKYVIPKQIENNFFIKNLFEDAMASAHKEYKLIAKLLLQELVYDYLVKETGMFSIDTRIAELMEFMKTEHKKKYNEFNKIAIENARAVLPNACETKIICTMNLRTLINFCHHRCCRRAQDEINELAWAMKEEIDKVSPLLGKCLGATCQFGKCPEGTMSCKNPYPRVR